MSLLFCLWGFQAKAQPAASTFFRDSCNSATGWTLGAGTPYPTNGEYTAWRVSNTGTCVIDGSSLAINAYNAPGAGGWSCNYLKDYSALDIKAYKQVDARGYNTLELEFDWYCKGEYYSGSNMAYDYGQVGYSTNGGSTFTWINTGGTSLGKYCASTAITRNAKISLPALLDNTQFLLAFRWVNDESAGTTPGFIVDNIRVMGFEDEVVVHPEQTIFSDACSNSTGWTLGAGTPYPVTGEYTGWRMSSIGSCGIDGSSLAINTWNGSSPNNWSCDYLFDYGNLDIKAYKQVNAGGYEDLKLTFDWTCMGEYYAWNSSTYDYGQVGYSTNGGSSFTWFNTGGTNGGKYYGNSNVTSDATILLPAALNNTSFLIAFRWINDESSGNAPAFVVDNIRVTGYSIGRGNSIPPNEVSVCSGDNTRNWTNISLFDKNGEKISESREYTDYLGRATQVQKRVFSDENTIATQTLYDAYGRAVLSTLAAPIDQNEICYKTNFITNAAGSAYTYADFDLPPSTGAAGEVDNPKPLGITAHNLGWYYSNSNFLESHVPASSFPYSRVELDENNLGAVKRAGQAGESHKMGSGHESYVFSMPLANELRYLDPLYAALKGIKTITVDANGVESVSMTDLDGKLIATGLSGQENGANVRTLSVTSKIKTGTTDNRFIDIHLPEGCQSSLSLYNPGNAITYQVLNLKTGQYVLFSGSANFTGTAPGLGAGYYRVIYKQGTAPAEISITYNVNYYHFSLNYYDKANRLTATVPPLGIDNNYDPNGSGQPNHQMKTSQVYNSLGWLISKNSPDEGLVEYVYRKDGSLRFFQNAKQKNGTTDRTQQRYSYINYDRLGRVVEVGEYDPTLGGMTNYYFENYAEHLSAPISNSVHGEAILESINTSAVKLDVTRCRYNTYTYYDSPAPSFTDNGLTGYTHDFLRGRVSGTANAANRTWYSYDQEGRVKWMVQRINQMPQAPTQTTKTVHYTYDFNGNVTEVAYQKDVTNEKFFHYYSYDADKRLVKVHTSRDGVKKDEQAEYYYYKHGPLRRVDLAGKLQGLDYVYTINGWLKSLNAPELSDRDPGRDGTRYSVSQAPPDLFGMSLDYFAGDYTRNNTSVQTYDQSATYNVNMYNGIVKAQRWKTQVPAGSGLAYTANQLMYAYQYDKKYQLSEARFGDVTSAGTQNGASPCTPYCGPHFSAGNDYRVNGIAYDANGNIQSLTRNAYTAGAGGQAMDQLSYTYTAGSNKLGKVTDAVGSSTYAQLNFKSGQGNNNYTYDATGQLTGDANESRHYEYDPFGNVLGVYNNAAFTQPLVRFAYDDRGFRIKKTTYNTSSFAALTDHFYVRDAAGHVLSVYEKNYATPSVAAQTELNLFGASRLGTYNLNSPAKYVYELSDHLGNVRSTFSKVKDMASETGFLGTGFEDYRYDFHGYIDNTVDISGGAGASAKLTYPHAQYGPALYIPVTEGQMIHVSIYSKHVSAAGTPVSALAFDLADASGNIIDGMWGLIDGPTGQWTENVHTFTISDNLPGMTLAVYPLNIDESGDPLWFDNFAVTVIPNAAGEGGWDNPQQLSITDYYPHGGIMPGRNFVSSTGYRYGYQGQFAEKDAETGFNSFELRQYDAKLGRWFAPDPYGQLFSPYVGMINDPVNMIDPDGGWALPDPTKQKYGHLGLKNNLALKGGLPSTFGSTLAQAVAAATANSLASKAQIDQVVQNLRATYPASGRVDASYPESYLIGPGSLKVAGMGIITVRGIEGGIITATGIKINGLVGHGVHRAIQRGVKPSAILNALKNPMKVGKVVTDNFGRQSQRFIGQVAEVVINPQTGRIISVNPTSSVKAARLLKK